MKLEEAIKHWKNNLDKWKKDRPDLSNTEIVEEIDYDYKAIETVLTHITKQQKMIDKMADEILELNTMIVEKEELFSVVPLWLGKEHIIEYFKGITNKKAEESE